MSDRSIGGTITGAMVGVSSFALMWYMAFAMMLGIIGAVVLLAVAVISAVAMVVGLVNAALYNRDGLRNFATGIGLILLGLLPGAIAGSSGIEAMEEFINGSAFGQIYCFFFWGITGILGAPIVLCALAWSPWVNGFVFGTESSNTTIRNQIMDGYGIFEHIKNNQLRLSILYVAPVICFFPWGFFLGSYLYGVGN